MTDIHPATVRAFNRESFNLYQLAPSRAQNDGDNTMHNSPPPIATCGDAPERAASMLDTHEQELSHLLARLRNSVDRAAGIADSFLGEVPVDPTPDRELVSDTAPHVEKLGQQRSALQSLVDRLDNELERLGTAI